jgi:hypothetical protein
MTEVRAAACPDAELHDQGDQPMSETYQATAERHRILGLEHPVEDDPKGILDHYEPITHDGLIAWLCRRCPHVNIIARDLEGDQSGLTLAEMAWSALAHEDECHAAVSA